MREHEQILLSLAVYHTDSNMSLWFESTVQKLDTLTDEIDELGNEVRALRNPAFQEPDSSLLPSLPFTAIEDLREFDTMLIMEDELRNELKITLQRLGGKDLSSFLRATLKTLICDELAVNITWRGTNEKPSFKQFTCFQIIKDVCHLKYDYATDNDINRIAQQHFQHARDRIASKKRTVDM